MKTIANCSWAEFFRQSNKIRHAVSDYLKETKILNIRKNIPDLTGLSEEEKKAAVKEQSMKNISDMMDCALDENAEKTVEVIGLLCFKEGKEIDELDSGDLMDVLFEVLTSERVLNFFMRSMKSGLISTENTSQKSN